MPQVDPNTGRYADEAEIESGDEALLESGTGRSPRRHPEDVAPDSPLAEGAPEIDVSARPASATTADAGPGSGGEDVDGLDETEQALRRAAEGQ